MNVIILTGKCMFIRQSCHGSYIVFKYFTYQIKFTRLKPTKQVSYSYIFTGFVNEILYSK